jgi:hypothetical protein
VSGDQRRHAAVAARELALRDAGIDRGEQVGIVAGVIFAIVRTQ